ncbi:MAG: hypothetical protein E7300_12000 [Lachnospiraceae bacterium]|jgi:flagellar hook-associated protein 2|nr:hypothetical protein [Lachnospiraceae bacterium]
MADMMALSTVYNHYLTTYANDTVSRYDTHKKSELRSIYNSIVKMNKESPLYLLNQSNETKAYAVRLKEGARELHNTIASLSSEEEIGLLNRKDGYSSDENIATAEYIGSETDKDKIPAYSLEVRALASPQENLGTFLANEPAGMQPGTYSFDIHVHNLNYEFQYTIGAQDTNKDIQEKLARLVNGAKIGIEAEVRTSEDSESTALMLRSLSTGNSDRAGGSFTVSDDNTSQARGSVAYFGIGDVARPARDAEVIVNGETQYLPTNKFKLDNTYEIELRGVLSPDGESTTIHVKNDTESMRKNLQALADGYNSFIDSVTGNGESDTKSAFLLREMRGLIGTYGDALGLSGMEFGKDGKLTFNANVVNEFDFDDKKVDAAFRGIQNFGASLLRKTSQISLNPMEYVDKKIVAYKNPTHENFATPYITSEYSGMMFNSYC